MSATLPPCSRAFFDIARPTRLRPVCQHIWPRKPEQRSTRARRNVSTAPPNFLEMEVEGEAAPRWSQTPPAMQAPLRSRVPREGVKPLKVNADPRKLDNMYIRFLGPGGDKMLSEETKWLAVTHKSFDHGRRGFNDRLAFLGKRIIELQTSLGLLSTSESSQQLEDDSHGREPFHHPAIDGVEVLTTPSRSQFSNHKEISKLSSRYGIPDIVRWVPRNPESLVASGSEMVYAQAVYAIIGALSLEQGLAIANQITKDKILVPIGLRRLTQMNAGISES